VCEPTADASHWLKDTRELKMGHGPGVLKKPCRVGIWAQAAQRLADDIFTKASDLVVSPLNCLLAGEWFSILIWRP